MSYFSDLDVLVLLKQIVPGYKFTTECNSIEFILRGKVTLIHGNESIELRAPAVFWMRKNENYAFSPGNRSELPPEHLYCDFLGPRSERIMDALERLFPEGYMVPKDPGTITGLFLEMIDLYRMDKNYYHAELVLCIEKLLAEMEKSLRPGRTEEDPYRILYIAGEIRKNPFQSFDFTSIAQKSGISSSHFRRLFRAAFSMPAMEYVRRQRLIRAEEMLSCTAMRIKDIVDLCAYSSLKDFSRSFKRYSGFSPREYRNITRKKDKRA